VVEEANQPRDDHQAWRQETELVVARHDGHQPGADRHQHDRQRQRLLAPAPIAVIAEENRAHRAGQIRDSDGAQRHQQGNSLVRGREKDLGNDDREVAVDQDFVEFERVAQRGSDDQPGGAGAGAVRRLLRGLCCGHSP